MTPEELAAVRERHRIIEGHNADGDERAGCLCGELWVCDAADLLAHIDAMTAAVEGLPTGTEYIDTGDGDGYTQLGSVTKYRAAVLAILRGEQ